MKTAVMRVPRSSFVRREEHGVSKRTCDPFSSIDSSAVASPLPAREYPSARVDRNDFLNILCSIEGWQVVVLDSNALIFTTAKICQGLPRLVYSGCLISGEKC